MTRELRKSQARRLLSTSEYRGLSNKEKAIKLIENNVASRRIAEEICGVSRRGIGRAMKAKEEGRDIGVNHRPPIFTDDESKELLKIIEDNYPTSGLNYVEIRKKMADYWIIKNQNKKNGTIPKFSSNYIRNFIKKNELKMKKPNILEQQRDVPEIILQQFYDRYAQTCTLNQYKPENIWNIDETMININENKSKVLIFNGKPPPKVIRPVDTEHLTLLLCVSANGEHLKPLVIFKRETVPDMSDIVKSSFLITGNDSGWMTGPILSNWINYYFVQHIITMRLSTGTNDPVLLIMDNHPSRRSIDTKALWEQHQIEILYLPAHSSHITQPLDLSVNGHFKGLLAKQNFNYNGLDGVNRRDMLLQKVALVLSSSLSRYIISIGWERSGLYPYDPSRLTGNLKPNENFQQQQNNEKVLKRTRGDHFQDRLFEGDVNFGVASPP